MKSYWRDLLEVHNFEHSHYIHIFHNSCMHSSIHVFIHSCHSFLCLGAFARSIVCSIGSTHQLQALDASRSSDATVLGGPWKCEEEQEQEEQEQEDQEQECHRCDPWKCEDEQMWYQEQQEEQEQEEQEQQEVDDAAGVIRSMGWFAI